MKTSKLKIWYLIASICVAVFVSYKYAISKTLDLKQEYSQLEIQSELYKDMPTQLAILKKREKYYDSLLTKFQINKGSIQHNLLKTLNRISEEKNVQLTSFVAPHVVQEKGLLAKTYQFTLEGNYNNILELVHHLEQNTKFGEILNLQFEKKKLRKTRKVYLKAKVYLKSFG
ncbi:hypothetical protein [Winogradskyella haliclonae]|uniref:Pilus assembly protein, PilO n=1 Tax=Winogradskyella haliclonae TaxID=2048558 RepID=A0ABQ2C476_9FLAO|nr:hypothetical protein [Winogradskyella haliclonae]GGI58503.1 hypothetical protein GCM10011444_28120 [Winogradskyella haliclonae]